MQIQNFENHLVDKIEWKIISGFNIENQTCSCPPHEIINIYRCFGS